MTGSLLFCPNCGTLLDLPKDGEEFVTCEQCEHQEPASCTGCQSNLSAYTYDHDFAAYENVEITTRSHPDAFPSALKQKRTTQTKLHDQGHQGMLVGDKNGSVSFFPRLL